MGLLEFDQAARQRPPAPSSEQEIKRSAFAELVGVSPSAVTQAIAKGRLHGRALGEGKRLVLPYALQQWGARRDPQADLAPRPKAPAPAPAAEEPAGDAGGSEYRDQKTRKARADAELAELALAEKRDQLRDRDEVARAMAACGARIGERLQSLPAMAEELAALGGDVAEVRAWLKRFVRRFRAQLADELESLAAGEESEADGLDLDEQRAEEDGAE